MKISMIAAMADNWVIGKDNQMPWHLPADLAHFKALTLGKPILMGRKTYESIGRSLPGRRNLVLSQQADYRIAGVEVVSSLAQAVSLLEQSEEVVDELMIIGGGALYRQLLAQADCLYLTRIELNVAGDTHFPTFSEAQWQRVVRQSYAPDERNPYHYHFETWLKKN